MHISELADAFHLRLGRLTQAAANLDFNVGLALNWLGSYNGLPVDVFLDPKKTQLKQRLDELKKLIGLTYDQTREDVQQDFEEWFRRVDAARALRNDYVHARWGFPGELKDEEPYVFYVSLNWKMDADKQTPTKKLTVSELDTQVKEVSRLVGDLGKLTKKHAIHMSPRMNGRTNV